MRLFFRVFKHCAPKYSKRDALYATSQSRHALPQNSQTENLRACADPKAKTLSKERGLLSHIRINAEYSMLSNMLTLHARKAQ